MKLRLQRTFAEAAAKILKALGRKEAAGVVRRGPSLIYKWSDPDLPNSPTIRQALDLDLEYVRKGHGAPPFLTTYASFLKNELNSQPRISTDQFLAETLHLLEVTVDLLAGVHESMRTDKKPQAMANARLCKICVNVQSSVDVSSNLAWIANNSIPSTICPLTNNAGNGALCGLKVGQTNHKEQAAQEK